MSLQLLACSVIPTKSTRNDVDQDGVVNELDGCPHSPPNAVVDEDGCSLFTGTLQNVDFAPGDYRLDAKARKALSGLVDALQQYPAVRIAVGGHTDNRGLAAENLALSKQRIMAVVRYLVINGIDGDRLEPFGYGESQPLMSNKTEAGRAANRRIELSIVAQ